MNSVTVAPRLSGLQADDPGAGEDVIERLVGDGVAKDAEQGLAHHLRRGAQPRVDVAL